ncbi:MAG: hypothetical protein ABI551_16605, partial [Polyangiaceae bacterium]
GEHPRVFVDVKLGRQLRIDVLTRDEGHRLLRALGWCIDQRSIRFAGKAHTWMLGLAVIAWYLLIRRPVGTLVGGPLSILLAITWFAAAFWALRPRIEIGADGIMIRRYFRSRFVSYREIGHASLTVKRSLDPGRRRSSFAHVLILARHHQPPVTVQLDNGDVSQAWTKGVLDRVEAALNAFHGRSPIDLPNELARGQRSAKEWISALRTLGSGAGDLTYRVATIEPERLFAVVESPTEPPVVRAAAAVALAKTATMEQRVRLKNSTKTVVEPRLRVALEAAIGEDEEALEGALHALEGAESGPGLIR